MLFARFDWFLYLGISSTIHLLAVSGEKIAREPHFVVKYSSYLGTAIKLVLYILKQLFASVSVNSGGYLPRRSGLVNIHRYSPPLYSPGSSCSKPDWTNALLVNFFISIYDPANCTCLNEEKPGAVHLAFNFAMQMFW